MPAQTLPHYPYAHLPQEMDDPLALHIGPLPACLCIVPALPNFTLPDRPSLPLPALACLLPCTPLPAVISSIALQDGTGQDRDRDCHLCLTQPAMPYREKPPSPLPPPLPYHRPHCVPFPPSMPPALSACHRPTPTFLFPHPHMPYPPTTTPPPPLPATLCHPIPPATFPQHSWICKLHTAPCHHRHPSTTTFTIEFTTAAYVYYHYTHATHPAACLPHGKFGLPVCFFLKAFSCQARLNPFDRLPRFCNFILGEWKGEERAQNLLWRVCPARLCWGKEKEEGGNWTLPARLNNSGFLLGEAELTHAYAPVFCLFQCVWMSSSRRTEPLLLR